MQSKLPLLFEASKNRAEVVLSILDACTVNERAFLIANPVYLGIRAEAYLAGAAPEWFALHKFLSAADRTLLADLAEAAVEDKQGGCLTRTRRQDGLPIRWAFCF